MRRYATIKRTENRVNELINGFDKFVAHFNDVNKFTGPSLYFHHQTIEMTKNIRLSELIQNDRFLEYIYATLTSWGMHRMGEGNTKLTDFNIFQNSVRSEWKNIEKLQIYEIDNIPIEQETQIMVAIYDILSSLKVGIGETKIVAGSKTLHHILPNLVPPIDGEYTMKFFYDNRTTALHNGEGEAFGNIFKNFCKIGELCKPLIFSHIGSGMNTSKTKTIDNAIIGYCDLLKKRENS